MEFRLTYAGPLYAHNESQRGSKSSKTQHKHNLRRHFHRQLKALWEQHPVLAGFVEHRKKYPSTELFTSFRRENFTFLPLVRGDEYHSLMCRLEIVMLRHGGKGGALSDIDNRLKTLSDALRMVEGPSELPFKTGSNTDRVGPAADEHPFYVLLENDKLLSAISVETDLLLERIPDPDRPGRFVARENAVRLFITATVRPYFVTLDMTSML